MPLLLPDHISTADEAVDALQLFLRKWRNSDVFQPFAWLATHPLEEARKVISGLGRDPGPGPVLRAHHHDAEASYVVGRPKVPSGRPTHTVQLPATELVPAVRSSLSPRQSPAFDALGSSVGLSEVSSAVVTARALAARAATSAELEPGRPGRYLRAEATGLLDFADRLEAEVPELGDRFLFRWRTEIDYLTPTPPPPAARPVALR